MKDLQNTHIILAEFHWTRDKDPRTPLAHGSLLATLKRLPNLEITSLVAPVNDANTTAEGIVTRILSIAKTHPKRRLFLAIGVYIWSERLIQQVLKRLRDTDFSGQIVLGGPQISYSTQDPFGHYPEADYVIRGYGELALAALVNGEAPADIMGLSSREKRSNKAQTEVDLKMLPSPWLDGVISLESQRFIRWETQRGCAYKCAFCQHREPGSRLKYTDFDGERLRTEIERFCAAGVQDIAILDPIFNQGAQSIEILKAFKAMDYRGHLSLQCRLETTTPAFIEAAAELNCTLEFGLQTTHRAEMKAIRRMNNLPKAEAVLAAIQGADIHHEISLIFGLPEQSLASFMASVQWCLDRKVPIIKAFPLMLLRGTPLDEQRERWALIENDDPMPAVIASSTFGPEDWQKMAALSNALKATEGHHPASAERLLKMGLKMAPAPERFSPQ